MEIKKAIKKNTKKHKRFIHIMILIFVILPIALFLSGKLNVFFCTYLIIIEILILVCIFGITDRDYLKFSYNKNKIRIKYGIFKKKLVISCDKVILVDIFKKDSIFDIIIITDSRIRKSDFKFIDGFFIKNYDECYRKFNEIKTKDTIYYYFIVSNGMYRKFELLDLIYKTCVHAHFTDDAISFIKQYRNQ